MKYANLFSNRVNRPKITINLLLTKKTDLKKYVELWGAFVDNINLHFMYNPVKYANERFVSKAPADKVQAERDKLEKYTEMLAQVKERMEGLGK